MQWLLVPLLLAVGCGSAVVPPPTGAAVLDVAEVADSAADSVDVTATGDLAVAEVTVADAALPAADGDAAHDASACDPKACTDQNPCTIDGCGDEGCVHVPSGAVACEDGDPCTAGDTCAAGACVKGTKDPCNDGNPCTTDACGKTGACSHAPNALPCDDANACTKGDACAFGACKAGPPLSCDDGLACTTDTCVAKAGCGHAPSSGPACDDGNACTPGSACAAGACVGSGAANCDDKNPCTNDGCDPKSGCVFSANANSCDDGDPCTGGDACNASACVPGKVPACASLVPAALGNSPCQLSGTLPQTTKVALVPWFSQLKAVEPIQLVPFPDGSDRLVYLSRPGVVRLFDNKPDVATSKVVLDIKPKVSTSGEGGLLSIAFHPNFKQNRNFYVNYTRYTSAGDKFETIIAEYTTTAADPEVADPASAKVLMVIYQPYHNHNGGQIFFDHSGKLLIGMGDGGSGGDPHNYGQDKLNLHGKMLRIDVDAPGGGKAYGIPTDNPFVKDATWKPETFASGLRNPWRFSVDRATGAIWAGDVGQGLWEEIDVIESGKNYGWRLMEGNACYNPKPCNKTGLTPPIAEYGHDKGTSVTGGYVYRGSQQPGLYGAYVFGDYGTGRVWSVTPPTPNATPATPGWKLNELAQTNVSMVSFGEDRDGELYAMQLSGASTIFKVTTQVATPPQGPAFPLKLSETQCFASLAPLQSAAGLLPYAVNAPLWSDGAAKQRWLVLPKGSGPQAGKPGALVVPVDPYASWAAPEGTLAIKHFALGDTATPVETRFLQRTAAGWQFWTYRWNAQGTDADLLPGGGSTVTYPVTLAGKKTTQPWTFPTTSQCAACHKAPDIAGQLLGVQTAQLNRLATWPGGIQANQLKVFGQAGLTQGSLTPAGPEPSKLAAFPDLGETLANGAPAVAQARAWLHSNCSHCHRPGGGAPGALDLRAGGPTPGCKAAPQQGNLGGKATAVVEPGQPGKSALWLRLDMGPGKEGFMPPLAVSVPHAAAYLRIAEWISGLGGCP